VGEALNGQSLEPDAAGAGKCGEEDSVAAEDEIAKSGDALDLEGDVGVEGADVAGVDAKGLAGSEVLDDDFAGEFEPGHSFAVDLLEEEAIAAEDAGAEGLLEADAERDARGGAEEAMAMDHVLVTTSDLDGDDVSGNSGGEGYCARGSGGAVLGHEEGSATGDAFERTQKAAATGVLGVGAHLDGLAHPGKFTSLGDDGVVVVERELEDGHGGSDDAMLHGSLLNDEGEYTLPPTPTKSAQSLRSR